MSLPRASSCLTVNHTEPLSLCLMQTSVSVILFPSSVPKCPRIFDSSSLRGRGFMCKVFQMQICFSSASAMRSVTRADDSALSLKSPTTSRMPSRNTTSGCRISIASRISRSRLVCAASFSSLVTDRNQRTWNRAAGTSICHPQSQCTRRSTLAEFNFSISVSTNSTVGR